MNLKNLSGRELHERTKVQAGRVREEITTLLHHLAEIDRRRLYLELACESLFSYCVRCLEMSEPQAARYVNAARALTEFPEIEPKISSGALTMTAVSQAQSFFKREEKANHTFSKEEKRDLLQKIEKQSTRETERILLSHSSQPEQAVIEKVRPVTDSVFELKVSVDSETLAHFERLREVWSHEMPGASFGQILKKMAKICREAQDPLMKAKRAIERRARRIQAEQVAETAQATPAPESRRIESKRRTTRYIPATIRHHVYMRDGGTCTFVDPSSGIRCSSRHLLQLDHVEPYGLGGANTVENLRLRCADHNALHASATYGRRTRPWRRAHV